jgi:2-keto-4-pentenoate hydratase/2-oxohepta-3-ene-1,7-dioic acid hydratase in catechol pathway
VSARDLQFSDGQWVRGKSLDTFCPVGPALVPAAQLDDPQDLSIRATLNGEVMQDSSTANMIFPVGEILEFVQQAITLAPGDLIATGTPDGVGAFRSPPVFLQHGDEITVEIEGLGALANRVVAVP